MNTQQLRICHIVEATQGGSARIVAQLLQHQMAQGHDVTLVYSPMRADQFFLDTIHAIPELKTIEIPMYRSIGLHDMRSLYNLAYFLRTSRYFDVLHSHCAKAGALTRLLRPLLARRSAMIHSPHSFYTMNPDAPPFYGWIERWLSWCTDRIIVTSEFERQHGTHIGIHPKQLHVIFNGIDVHFPTTRTQARSSLDLDEDQPIVGFVGRFTHAKNLPLLVETFAAIAMHHQTCQFVIVGHGDEEDALRSNLNKHHLLERTHIFSANDARHIIPAFDCLVCTSLYESFCLVLLEAMVAGVPAAITRVGIACEIIEQGVNGYMGDYCAEELASYALTLLEQTPEDRIQMRDALHATITRFSQETMLDQTIALYVQTKTRSKNS